MIILVNDIDAQIIFTCYLVDTEKIKAKKLGGKYNYLHTLVSLIVGDMDLNFVQ